MEAGSPLLRPLLLLLAISAGIFAYDRLRDESATAAAVGPAEAPGPVRAPPRSSPPREPLPAGQAATHAPGPTGVQPPAGPRPAAPSASPAPQPRRARPSTYSYDWHEGANGFARGLEEARTDGRALAVYFHTDWCGYCRQLESELLERAKVENYLKYLVKVKINPERGRNERRIAERYGVTGYPSFFVHAAADGRATKVGGMVKRNGEWEVKTPDEFVQTVRRVVGD